VTSDHAIPASTRNIFVRSSTNSADAGLRRGDSSALLQRRNHHHAIGEIERLLVPPEKRLIVPPRAGAPPYNRCELTRPRGGRHTGAQTLAEV